MDGSMDGGGGGGPPGIFESQGMNPTMMQGIEQTLGNNANQILARGQLQDPQSQVRTFLFSSFRQNQNLSRFPDCWNLFFSWRIRRFC